LEIRPGKYDLFQNDTTGVENPDRDSIAQKT
jgi:hypothetical protein